MIYQFNPGKHNATPERIRLVTGKKITYLVRFDHNCEYDLGPDIYQLDINKLFGVGYFPGHHTHSARIGWRWSKDKEVIEIFGYVYDGGVRKVVFIGDCKRNTWYQITIFVDAHAYNFELTNRYTYTKTAKIILEHRRFAYIGYGLNPYFGGDRPAPHKMTLETSKL